IASRKYEPDSDSNLLRLRLDALLHRVANRRRVGGRTRLRGALEGRAYLVAAETGIRVAPPPSWIDSMPALQGSEIAREAGVFPAYHDAVFRAAFEQGADIANGGVLDAIADRAGIDRSKFRAALDSGAMSARLAGYKREADEFSAFGYPAFILGEFPMVGIQTSESMRLLLGRFIRQRSAEPQA